MTGYDRPQTGRAALRWAVSFLTSRGWLPEQARLESRILLGRTLGLEELQLAVALEEPLPGETWSGYEEKVVRLSRHEPLQYITGQQNFMGLTFRVTPSVLIPRWDTEILVEEALRYLEQYDISRILDLGTGSGVIALSLAYYCHGASVWAVDISEAALAVAGDNAQALGVMDRVTLLEGDLFAPLPQGVKYDLIVSNPPYISEGEYRQLSADVKKEPALALTGGRDGLDYYRRIAAEAACYLAPQGLLLLEIGWQQGEAVAALLLDKGWSDIKVLPDHAGHQRVVRASYCMA